MQRVRGVADGVELQDLAEVLHGSVQLRPLAGEELCIMLR